VVSVGISAEDQYYNPVRVSPSDMRWSVDPQLATVDPSGRLTAANPALAEGATCAEGTVWVEAGTGRVPLVLRVYAAPPRLVVTPAAARLRPGQAVRLTARTLDENGKPISCPPDLLRWDCPTSLGTIDESGTLR